MHVTVSFWDAFSQEWSLFEMIELILVARKLILVAKRFVFCVQFLLQSR